MKRLKIVGGLMAATAVMALFGAACGGDEEPTATATARPATATSAPATATRTATTAPATTTPSNGAGDPVKGQTVFNSKGCAGCHSTGTNTVVGPGLGGVATRAATRKPGMSAQAYLDESILAPSAFVVPGFTAGVMPTLFQSTGDEGFKDLVAYLLTLK